MEPIKVTYNSIQDIDPEKRFLIDELTIVGKFVLRSDLVILRSMCNSIVDGKRTGGNLSVLDLSKLKSGDIDLSWFDVRECISLKKLKLPASSTWTGSEYTNYYRIKGTAFSGCKSLENIEILDSSNSEFFTMEGVLFTRNYTRVSVQVYDNKLELVKFPANKGNEYTIPQDTKKIADSAFEDSHLTKLTMPTVPPTCNEDAFKGVNRAAMTLVVPKGTFNSYWMHPVYGKFKIVELDE